MSLLNPLNWFRGSDDSKSESSIWMEQFDDAVIGMLKTVDTLHSATLSHIRQLNKFMENNCTETSCDSDSDIGLQVSKETLQCAELSLMHNKHVLVKVLRSLQPPSPDVCLKLEAQMTNTYAYIDTQNNDDEAVARYADDTRETSNTIIKLKARLDKLEEHMYRPVTKEPTIDLPPQVQVCSQADSSVSSDATLKLMEKLNRGADVTAQYTFTIPNLESAKRDIPLLIMCVHSSRLWTDALNAIKGISNPKKTALVIVHYKEEHALSETPSQQILVGTEFDKIGGIFDIAYTKDKGVYPCKMNTKSQEAITSFIKN